MRDFIKSNENNLEGMINIKTQILGNLKGLISNEENKEDIKGIER